MRCPRVQNVRRFARAAYSDNVRRRRGGRFDRAYTAVAGLDLPPAVFKTCPWQPRTLVETGLRQWLRCCAPALCDHQVIGMPSRAVDEAWHGLILCTARYSAFCTTAYGQFLHHHPDGGAPAHIAGVTDPVDEQLPPDSHRMVTGREARRTVRPVGSRRACRCGPAVGSRSRPGRRDPSRSHNTQCQRPESVTPCRSAR